MSVLRVRNKRFIGIACTGMPFALKHLKLLRSHRKLNCFATGAFVEEKGSVDPTKRWINFNGSLKNE